MVWYGHVKRRDEGHVLRRILESPVRIGHDNGEDRNSKPFPVIRDDGEGPRRRRTCKPCKMTSLTFTDFIRSCREAFVTVTPEGTDDVDTPASSTDVRPSHALVYICMKVQEKSIKLY